MKKIKLLPVLGLVCFFWGINTVEAFAAPHFVLIPSNKTINVGDELSIDVAIESGTVKVAGADAVINFDSDKLDYVGTTSDTSIFPYDASTFRPTLQKVNQLSITMMLPGISSVVQGNVVSGKVMTVKFKAKTVGTALVSFECKDDMINETNVVELVGQIPQDKIVCSENSTGTYIIAGASTTGTPTLTPTPTPTQAVAAVTAVATSAPVQHLPQTGNTETTIFMTIIGVVSVIGAWIFKIL